MLNGVPTVSRFKLKCCSYKRQKKKKRKKSVVPVRCANIEDSPSEFKYSSRSVPAWLWTMLLREAVGQWWVQSSGALKRVLWGNSLPETVSSFPKRATEERVGSSFFSPPRPGVQMAGKARWSEVRGSWSSGPVSPWCSTAYASWTGWWRHRVSVQVLGGNWLQLHAASRWGGGSPPGSSRLQDTETQRESESF